MKSIQRRFKKAQENNPNSSTLTCFISAVIGQNVSEDRIKRMFNELVDKEDYTRIGKKMILKSIYALTKSPKRTRNNSKFPL